MKRHGCSIIFVNDQQQVLLFLRDDKPGIAYPNMWDVLGGHLEKGETPEEGVLREVKEELSLSGQVLSFIGYYSFQQMNQLILAFHVQATGDLKLGAELAEVKRIAPTRLKPWSFGTGLAVRDWLALKSTD